MKGQTTHITKCLLIAATLFAAAVASPLVASAGNPNPGVLPINSSPYGKSYGSWTEAWWQWVLSIPAAQNPELDTTGQDAGIGQSGPVWFMSATFGNLPNVVRTFTIPAGKTLFLPVYPWLFGASAGDCEPSSPGVPCDVPTLRDLAAAAATSIQTMEVSIDGVPVQDLRSYRAFSPDAFSVTLPANNALQYLGLTSDIAGTYYPQVSDGYWLMLTPLSAGKHTITVHLIPDPTYGSEQLITYNLTISGW